MTGQRLRFALIPALLLVAACGGDDDDAATTAAPGTEAATATTEGTPETTEAATTTERPTTTQQTTTTTAPAALSRDAILAVQRCLDVFGFLPLRVIADLNINSPERLETAIAACDEAHLQVEVDLGVASELAKAVATINVLLAELNLAYLTGESLEQASPAYEAFAAGIGPAIADVEALLPTG